MAFFCSGSFAQNFLGKDAPGFSVDPDALESDETIPPGNTRSDGSNWVSTQRDGDATILCCGWSALSGVRLDEEVQTGWILLQLCMETVIRQNIFAPTLAAKVAVQGSFTSVRVYHPPETGCAMWSAWVTAGTASAQVYVRMWRGTTQNGGDIIDIRSMTFTAWQ